MTDNLAGMARILETVFFTESNSVLDAQRKKLQRMEHTKKALSEISGITDQSILQRLAELDISPEVMASLALTPLVLVAWADGEVDEKERGAVLKSLKGYGIVKGDIDYALLEEWLKMRPPHKMINAWTHYISGLCAALSAKERKKLKANIMRHSMAVAEASGGFLSLMKISPEEEATLKRLSGAFDPPSARK